MLVLPSCQNQNPKNCVTKYKNWQLIRKVSFKVGDLNLNIYNILILTGIIHGIVFSLILIFNSKLKSQTNSLLAATVLSLVFSNLQYWVRDVKLYLYEGELFFIPFEFLMLPFFYLFTKSYLQTPSVKAEKIFLFLPFVLTTCYILIINNFDLGFSLVKILNRCFEYLSILFSVSVIILIFKAILSYEKSNSNYVDSKVKISTSWLKRVLLIGLSLCFLWLLSISIFRNYFEDGYHRYYPLWIGIAILIYWIGYTSIFKTNILKERIAIRASSQLEDIIQSPKVPKPKQSNEILYNEICNWIVSDRAFLNPDLKLENVAEKFNISKGYFSKLISAHSDQNFNEYINVLRVEESKKMLINKNYNNYTVTAIGLESGFNSKSSFYTAFKKHVGKTPVNFKKESQI